jgi:hypothetical protein
VIQPWTPWRAPGGDYQLYPLSTWGDTRRGPCKTGALSLTGDEWIQLTLSGAHYKEQQIAFEIKSVFLDQATWLSDGRILMRGMADEACSPTGAGLYVAYLSGQPRQIVQTASPYTSDDPKALLWGVAFAVSPDESLVAWAENDTAAARSTIHLTPIDDGEASTLLAITPPENGAPFDYQDNHLILAFIWLP